MKRFISIVVSVITGIFMIFPMTATAFGDDYITHWVWPGQTWEDIARLYQDQSDLTGDGLREYNENKNIEGGMTVVRIPVPPPEPVIPTESLAPEVTGLTPPPILELIAAQTSQSVPVESSTQAVTNFTYYSPQSGDGWYRIARKFNTDVNSLLAVNNANINTMIYVGVPIKIPSSKSGATPVEGAILGEVTLKSSACNESWTNIKHACDLLNGDEGGLTVNSGKMFSWAAYPPFNYRCGLNEGFIEAPVYPEGKAPGGGICFVSTSLYQCAVLQCGMEKLERHSHSKPVTYAVSGEDASVNLTGDKYAWDMRFRNTTEHDVKFVFQYNDKKRTLTVTCFTIN
jgi:LysM repeat protein